MTPGTLFSDTHIANEEDSIVVPATARLVYDLEVRNFQDFSNGSFELSSVNRHGRTRIEMASAEMWSVI